MIKILYKLLILVIVIYFLTIIYITYDNSKNNKIQLGEQRMDINKIANQLEIDLSDNN